MRIPEVVLGILLAIAVLAIGGSIGAEHLPASTTTLASSGLWNLVLTTAIWGVISAVSAAAVAGRLTRSVKISEFRQNWIIELRKDIADYVGAAWKWFRSYEELNDILDNDKKIKMEREKLFPIANEARVILWRIRMRINPRGNNPNKAQDDRFLNGLDDLLNPGKLDERNLEASWVRLADDAVEQAREILKREWEVTKTGKSKAL